MKKTLFLIVALICLGSIRAKAQGYQFNTAAAAQRIQSDICILASDSLLGREAGTIGEWMARKYIESKFKEIGLKPLFDTSYFQAFTFTDGDGIMEGTNMDLNGKKLMLYRDYYPIGFSASDTVSGDLVFVGTGIYCESAGINDYQNKSHLRGKIAVIDLAVPDNILGKKSVRDSAQKVIRVNRAAAYGAIGVIFISTEKEYGTPSKDPNFYKERVNVPVVFVTDSNRINRKNPGKATIMVDINRTGTRKAYNVGGYIDNGAENTVIIGAHYDHLGLGFVNSREAGDNSVHNGADDNASGVAGVLEMARLLKVSDMKKNNYIFLAFSGEEKGLIGSEKFVTEGGYPKEKMNYMIDFDMIGRLNSEKKVKIYGTGTSETWETVIDSLGEKDFNINRIKAGIGGSDHSSFNQHQVPALFLHTGLHEEYHKAVDDCDLINAEGADNVVNYAYLIIKSLDNKGKITYQSPTLIDDIMQKK